MKGEGFAVIVNANAKRGGRRIAAQIARALPGARVKRTQSAEELTEWLRSINARSLKCVFAAGGDGTTIGLLNALNVVIPVDQPFPRIGLLPLGTGNAWARTVGARKLGWAVHWLAERSGEVDKLPTRRFNLVECEGKLASFAGSGWDAQVLNDFRSQVEAAKGPSKVGSKSGYGYLGAIAFRTVPKSVIFGRPRVLLENLGTRGYKVTPDGRIEPLENLKVGQILYDGFVGVSGAATIPEYGFGFKAFPWAERIPGLINMRIYDDNAARAFSRIATLWRGEYVPGMNDWFLESCRMTFSRPCPFQIGGDPLGERRSVDFKISSRVAEVLYWRALA